MADGVVLNAGAGGVTAVTDDCGVPGHAQVVKLAISTDGSATLIPADSTNGIQVNVTKNVPGTGATNLGKAEDAAHSSGDTGVMALTVRQDTAAALAGTDGDYQPPITDANGRLHVIAAVAASQTLATVTTVGTVTAVTAITNALPAGANAIGKLAANSGVDIGDVDITSLVPGTTATSLGKAEDAAHSSGDVGVMALTVRQDTPAALAGTDGDYQPPITDASGRLHVNVGNTINVASHAVTNAGTFLTQENGAALTALQLIDDAVFAEDIAAQAADKGIAVLAVRRDADTSLVGTDNDYANLQVNATGSLKVAITSGAGSGGTSIADGASFTRDTTSVTLAAAVVETSAPALTNGDAAALSMTTGGALRVAVASGGVAGIAEDSASAGGEDGVMMLAVRRDAASSGVGTDGDFAALSVTSDGSLRVSGGGGGTQYAEDVAAASGDTGTMALAVRRDTAASSSGTDGDYSTLNVNASGRLWAVANIDQINGVTPLMGNGASGTGALRVSVANDSTGILAGVTTVTTVTTLSTLTGGAIAHDGADSGNPIKIGAKASSTLSDDTMVANGDRTDATSDIDGALITRPQYPLGDSISERVSNTDGASTAFSNFGATASTRNLIFAYSIFRTDAGTTPIYVDFRDGTAGAILWSVVLPPNGGANLASPVPLFKTTANTALAFDVSAATSTVFISIAGCKSKVT